MKNDNAQDPRSTMELVNVLLTNRDEDADVAGESAYWNAMSCLLQRGTGEVFNAAKSLSISECELEQRIGCGILAQLGSPVFPFAAESFPLVASVLRRTDHLDTLANAICALGWLQDVRGVDLVLPYIDYKDEDIRYWVTHALTAMDQDKRSIDGLIRLSSDSSASVRDWAAFGLGSQTEMDSTAIREALIARLDDSDIIVRGEALVGLAKRQDQRVVEPLRQALESGVYGKEVSDYAGEALDAIEEIARYPDLWKWKNG